MTWMCPVKGMAEILRVVTPEGEDVVWEKADQTVHVHETIWQSPQHLAVFEEKYEIGEWCPYAAGDTKHARLKPQEDKS